LQGPVAPRVLSQKKYCHPLYLNKRNTRERDNH